LAGRGRKASNVIADYARRQEIAPSVVLCSSAVRTRETLDRLLPALGSPEVLIERGLYEASAGDLLARLREVPDAAASVLLVGHQPAIQQLALGLAGDGEQLARLRAKFPTAAMATLLFVGEWGLLEPGCAELVDYVKPKELPA
jgi:phosphohistidine phosphatase